MRMMTSEGGSAETTATASVDPSSLQNYPAEGSQGHTYQYYPAAIGSAAVSWPTHGPDNSATGNGSLQNSGYQYNQQQPSSVQDGTNASSTNSYASYPTSTNAYGYGSSEYTNYYTGYQQQSNPPYTRPLGPYQNSGSAYQPISSFQNTGSYSGPTSYSSTYYNPGDYQTTGAYTGNNYNSQTNSWSQGNYANYTNQYPNYSQDSSSTYSSSSVPSTTSYEQQYKQWADYYSSQSEVTCAPGTENTSVPSTAALSCPIPGVSGGYAAPISQSQPSYAPAWKPESSPSTLPSVQSGNTVGGYDDYWKHATQAYQNQHVSSSQSNFQKPLDVNLSHPSVQDQSHTALPQVPNLQYTGAHQVQQNYQQPLPPPPPIDIHRVSKLQIPTNPRIAPNLSLGLPKTSKETSPSSVAAKPAYVSVSLPKTSDKALSSNASESSLKPGMFPASLRGYVERALARCKDEKQRAACQEVMKEIITKATADGTLHSRDWDTEPLFPLPDISVDNNEQSAVPMSSLSTLRRSPSRRTKSRWEPLPEEKAIEKPTSTYQDSAKHVGWLHFNGKDRKYVGKSESKDAIPAKLYTVEQSNASRGAHRPVKRQRFGNETSASQNGDASSGSDKEQGLTAYYSGAVALTDSPEEKKRRENRSKRFEKGNGQRAVNHFRPKNIRAGNLHARKATALVLSKTFDDGGSRAVEDIDWDALTVKGTCQEIEKCYLRLTSAPDPTTVRPEEVLEKALHVVQNSQKNYLYKCDQLKSIRQDLTVQRIHNELTVKVYETHARLALEFGDLPEYNQCQSQLKSLYAEGIAGCQNEFSAYNLLSVILHSSNRRELLSLMSRLSDEAKKHEAVRHALSVRAAVTSGNYVLFFRLYKTAPYLNTCLMDLNVEKMRFEGVKCMSRAYRPTIPVPYVAHVLGFGSALDGEGVDEKDVDGLEECTEWLKAHGACLIADISGEMMVDAKASSSSLFMPEPEDAVAHGDANLAVNDFLTRAPL